MNTSGVLLTAANNTTSGAIYLGTEQFITLVSVIGVFLAILVFLAKHQFKEITDGIKVNTTEIQSTNSNLQDQIRKNNDKINERIDKLECKTETEIANIKKELGDIKGDFATTFVLREDFFRVTNKMEESVKEISRNTNNILLAFNKKP